jgi:hypothetical protein
MVTAREWPAKHTPVTMDTVLAWGSPPPRLPLFAVPLSLTLPWGTGTSTLPPPCPLYVSAWLLAPRLRVLKGSVGSGEQSGNGEGSGGGSGLRPGIPLITSIAATPVVNYGLFCVVYETNILHIYSFYSYIHLEHHYIASCLNSFLPFQS